MKIVLPYDGSASAQRALELLAAHQGPLDTVLLNVQPRPIAFWPGAGLDPGSIEAVLIEEGRATLGPAAKRLSRGSTEREVRLGMPADCILRETVRQQADAIVMGTRGHGALHGYAFGSVALRVAHGGAAPVWLVKPSDKLPEAFGRRLRVLVAMDGSAPALRAVERLVAWRDWLGDLEVHLTHAQEPLTLVQAMLPPHDDLVRQWSTEEGTKATQAARDLLQQAGIRHHVHLTTGDPALEVRMLVEKTGAELAALGTRGLGAAHHALVGSVALKAAIAVQVPVLLVP
jgi:nucleotide-binding universal stress UspA family protein